MADSGPSAGVKPKSKSPNSNIFGQRKAGRKVDRSMPDGLCLREIQFHADAVRVVEKELRVAGARHDAFTEFYVPGLQALAHAIDVGGGKGDVVEPSGVL